MQRFPVILVAGVCALAGCASPRGADLPFDDDFSGPGCDWSTDSDETYELDCVDGAYRILVHDPATPHGARNFFSPEVNALRFEADAYVRAGPRGVSEDDYLGYGVGCWSRRGEQGYTFFVTPDGGYAVAKDAGSPSAEFLVEALAESPPAGWNERNRLRADCASTGGRTTLVFSINGKEVAVVRDEAGHDSFEAYGFYVTTSARGTDVRFDDASARELSESEARTLAAREETAQAGASPLPLEDDFSDPGSGWATAADEDVSLGYADGAYRFRLTAQKPQWSLFPLGADVGAVRIEAEATKRFGPKTSELGLACYLTEEEGYLFAVTPAGGYAILRETVEDFAVLEDGHADAAFGASGTPIRVRVDCIGGGAEPTVLVLAVNGREVARATDDLGLDSFASLGLFAFATEGTEISFDDFAARELSAGEVAGGVAGAAVAPPARPRTRAPGPLFAEHFAERKPEWPVEKDDDGSVGYARGGYRIAVTAANTGRVLTQDLGDVVDGVRIDVQLTQAAAAAGDPWYGVTCSLDQADGYTFAIGADDGSYYVFRDAGTSSRALVNGSGHEAIRKPPAPNHLRAECEGGAGEPTRLRLFVNGRPVAEAEHAGGVERFNSLGLTATASTGPLDVVADDLVARRLR